MTNLLRSASNVVLIMMLSLCCATFTSCSSDDDAQETSWQDKFEWDNVCFDLSESKYSQIEVTPNGHYIIWFKKNAKSEPEVYTIGEYERVGTVYQFANATLEVREYSSSTNTAVIVYTVGSKTETFNAKLGERIKKIDDKYRVFASKWTMDEKIHHLITYKGKVIYDEYGSILNSVKYIPIIKDDGSKIFMQTFYPARQLVAWFAMSGIFYVGFEGSPGYFHWKWGDKDENWISYYRPNISQEDNNGFEPKRIFKCEGDKMLNILEYDYGDWNDGMYKDVVMRVTLYYSEIK